MYKMRNVPIAALRRDIAEVIGAVKRRRERVKVLRYGRTAAVLIPAEDLQRLENCEKKGSAGRARRKR